VCLRLCVYECWYLNVCICMSATWKWRWIIIHRRLILLVYLTSPAINILFYNMLLYLTNCLQPVQNCATLQVTRIRKTGNITQFCSSCALASCMLQDSLPQIQNTPWNSTVYKRYDPEDDTSAISIPFTFDIAQNPHNNVRRESFSTIGYGIRCLFMLNFNQVKKILWVFKTIVILISRIII